MFPFPTAGCAEIPLSCERELVETIQRTGPFSDAELGLLRADLEFKQAYELAILAVRVGVWALRTNQVQLLGPSLAFLAIGEDVMDCRDLWVTCSLIADAASRLGVDADTGIEELIAATTQGRSTKLVRRKPGERTRGPSTPENGLSI